MVKWTEHQIHHLKPFLHAQFSRIKYIHTVEQQASRILFILQNWNPLNTSQFSPPPVPTTILHFLLLWISLLPVPHIEGIRQYLSFCDWLILLSIIYPRFIDVVVCARISFLFKADYYSIVNICHILFIQPLMGTWIASTFVAIVKNLCYAHRYTSSSSISLLSILWSLYTQK